MKTTNRIKQTMHFIRSQYRLGMFGPTNSLKARMRAIRAFVLYLEEIQYPHIEQLKQQLLMK